jgi:site-specific recombinase XerD
LGRWGLDDPAFWDTIFAAHSGSTRSSYQAIFSKFLKVMHDSSVTIQSVQLKHVFTFLQPLIAEKKAASTLRSYVAALKFYFLVFEREDLANSRLLDFFSTGAQRLAPLPVRKAFVWDAGIPLKMIRDRPHPTTFLAAAREALFLLLMATGCRVDYALKMGKDFCWEREEFVIPYLVPRKCKVKGQWTRVQRIAQYSGSGRICPINAILLYSTFAVSVQKADEPALFVSSTGSKAAKATLARWVRDLLHEAGIKARRVLVAWRPPARHTCATFRLIRLCVPRVGLLP